MSRASSSSTRHSTRPPQATITTQLMAVMTNVRYGLFSLSVVDRWVMACPDGTILTGPWSEASNFTAAGYANLATYGPTTLQASQNFGACVAPPETPLVFSLPSRQSIHNVFTQVNGFVPAGAREPVCWSARVAA